MSVVENTAGSIYQATATDPGGAALTYSISGGLDASRFRITPSGQLAFATAPNYDLPANVNGDNVYQVQISASDGKTSSVLALAVTVTNSKEGIAVHRVATGFTNPVGIAPISDAAVLVAEKAGAIYMLNPKTGAKTLLAQVGAAPGGGVPDIGGAGVTAIAASPTFASDGVFYVMYVNSRGVLLVWRYFSLNASPSVPDNEGPLLLTSAPNYAGGGWLGFDSGGALLVATSDGGGVSDPTGSAQDPVSRLGKMIRVTPNPDPYAGASPIYFLLTVLAEGLHQPNGGSLLRAGILIADHGQDTAEELDLLPAGAGDLNFGWPYKEGTQTANGPAPAGLADPVAQYFRGSGPRNGQGIIGGAMGPTAVASLKSQYVFGDSGGAIFTIDIASIVEGATLAAATFERRDADFAPDQGTINHPVAITAGPGGALYIVDADGDVFRVDAG